MVPVLGGGGGASGGGCGVRGGKRIARPQATTFGQILEIQIFFFLPIQFELPFSQAVPLGQAVAAWCLPAANSTLSLRHRAARAPPPVLVAARRQACALPVILARPGRLPCARALSQPAGPRARAPAPPHAPGLPPVTTPPAVPSWRLFPVTSSNGPSSWTVTVDPRGNLAANTQGVRLYASTEFGSGARRFHATRSCRQSESPPAAYRAVAGSKHCKLGGMWQTHSYKGCKLRAARLMSSGAECKRHGCRWR
ncbi:uncharacterized protein LOC105915149 [Setaria italica]|uniref:uncharacterized protein LOC105915149 n=1 Tax=Setaria italica TaxID=4555 RepID=UPI000BE4E4D6|nr:uncharacterized protein LOC105915149 [Setaria italica]